MSGSSNTKDTYDTASSAGALWEDPEFGADASSLTWESYGFGSSGTDGNKDWKRPSEMGAGYPTTPSLFGDYGKPVPNGIRQMALGDCWFLAATSSVA